MAPTNWPGLENPIRTIYAVGRNYAAHARELKNEVPEKPVIFLKPAAALLFAGAAPEARSDSRGAPTVPWPADCARLDHEVELVVALGAGGKRLDERAAADAIAAIAVGIDLTARDWQDEAKRGSLPWTLAKGFDGAAVVSEFRPAPRGAFAATPDWKLRFWVDGELRQEGSTGDMIFSVPRVIAFLSRTLTLQAGDIIFTGTPSGVGPLQPGESIRAELGDGVARLEARIGARE